MQCNTRESRRDLPGSLERSREAPGDLGNAAGAIAVANRQFQSANAGARGVLLLSQVPAVAALWQAERLDRVGGDRPHGSHVGVWHAVEKSNCQADATPGESLMRAHAAALAIAAQAGAD